MPAAQIKTPDPGNKGFLRALLAATICMMLSAAILTAGFLAWHYTQITAPADIEPITITRNDLFIAIGKGKDQDDKLVVTELTGEGAAVISSRLTRFNASNYPILEYTIKGRTPGTEVVLYWRTVTHNHQTLFAELHWNGDNKASYNMQIHPEWKGQITELGISIAGDLRNTPISIEQLTFSPLTIKTLLRTVWTEWNAFGGWTHASINVIKGMPPNALISPVVAAAAWCGLAILLYSIRIVRTPFARRDMLLHVDRNQPGNPTRNITKKIWDIRAIMAMFLIAWLSLDWKWQVNLWQNLADTKYLFAGKTHHEQHLAAEDAGFYELAQKLREAIPLANSGRLFILSNRWKGFARLKTMYYMLPYNIYNFGASPDNKSLRNGDLLLALESLSRLNYDPKRGKLLFGKGNAMQAFELYASPSANLYIVKENTFLLESIKIKDKWKKLSVKGRVLPSPLIFAGIPSYHDRNPGIIALSKDAKVRSVVRIQEWNYQDGRHSIEDVAVLFAAKGRHKMKDGAIWEVGEVAIPNSDEWHKVNFDQSFVATPSVFLMPQNSDTTLPVIPRANRVDQQSFHMRIDTEESSDTHQVDTKVAYLAIHSSGAQGSMILDGKEVNYQLTTLKVSSEWTVFEDIEIRLQEEHSSDVETHHPAEMVNLLVLDGKVFGQVISSRSTDTVGLRMRKK